MEQDINLVKNRVQETFTINKSKFISLIFDANQDNYQEILKQLKREYLGATHICYAYRFCNQNLDEFVSEKLEFTQGYFDDGEPSGTAGFPILKSILDNNLVNALVVVVRYFGGVKLGAATLLKTYRKSADLCVVNNIKPINLYQCYLLNISYVQFNTLSGYFSKNNIIVFDKSFDNGVVLKIAINDNKHFDYLKNNIFVPWTIEYLGDKYL